MLVEGVEHLLRAYNDDNGYGLTLYEKRVGPWDIGPRLDEAITCVKCEKIRDSLNKVGAKN